jgi:hypothetical protein
LTGMSGAVKFLVLFTALLYFGVLVIPPIATQPPTLPPGFETALATTAAASTISTAISLPAALLFAFYGLRRGLAPVMPAVTFSTAVPHTAVGLLLLPLFARLGVVDTFPAVVAAMSVVSTPIGVGTLSTLFSNRNKGLDEFLQTLSLKRPRDNLALPEKRSHNRGVNRPVDVAEVFLGARGLPDCGDASGDGWGLPLRNLPKAWHSPGRHRSPPRRSFRPSFQHPTVSAG